MNGAVFDNAITQLHIAKYHPGDLLQFRNVSIRPNQKQYQRWATSQLQIKFNNNSTIAKVNGQPLLTPLAELETYLKRPALTKSHGFMAFIDSVISAKEQQGVTVLSVLDHSISAPIQIEVELPMAELFNTYYEKKICIFQNLSIESRKLRCKNQETIIWIDTGSEPARALVSNLIAANYIDDYNFLDHPSPEEIQPTTSKDKFPSRTSSTSSTEKKTPTKENSKQTKKRKPRYPKTTKKR
ncbi:uncharacterized protein LOC129596901 [Paramacrobiotus metropolitanus]|uniref:uncharacterized protein LOC129596901 n=1 Tax=Paramacrobiotus metropolitanus TaxID=2943436 RepID=UPI002445FD67|nr:uncharacterized protein LOC129596901 [Paramacrobiotus metropolitanus]